MPIVIETVQGRRALAEYIHLPAHLVGRRENWVPPIWRDERKFHDPATNPELKECEVVRFFARNRGILQGRIMGIIHHGYNGAHNEHTARFYQLDCVNDPAIAGSLLHAVEEWARNKGMDRIIGPFGLSDKDPQGLQVEGFEHLPVIATATNPPYLPQLVERAGFAPFVDCLVYRFDVPDVLPKSYHLIAERVMRAQRLRRATFRSRRELKPWIVPVLMLMNKTYHGLLGFTPLNQVQMHHLAAQYLPLLDPRFVILLVDENDLPAAFVVAMPDMSEGIQRAGGYLFPFGFLHILAAMRRSSQLDLFLGAVRPDLQGMGVTAALCVQLMEVSRSCGMTAVDSHLVLETNVKMRAELERLNAKVQKRYRIYARDLGEGNKGSSGGAHISTAQ